MVIPAINFSKIFRNCKEKNRADLYQPGFCHDFVGLLALYVAISAVYRFIAARLKRYLSFLTALRANSGEHLARTSAHTAPTAAATISLGPSILTADRASFWLIGVAFGCEEFLLLYGKRKSFSAIGTGEGFLLKRHVG
jgi:hypothetical protein